jgi:AraC-like DNA-binding protein
VHRDDTLSEQRRLYLLGRVVVSRYYRRRLTLGAVARALSTSPRQLQRAYAQFGDSFHEDLFARRMSVAGQLLAEQRAIPVEDVARLVGYRQPSSFAAAFRRRYGLSPARFRERAVRYASGHPGSSPASPPAGHAVNGRLGAPMRGRPGSRPGEVVASGRGGPRPGARLPAG